MAQINEFRMKLSDRMQVIADHVEQGETLADIGTDHGQIPVWLFARGICPRVILSDISEGSIRKAKETAAAYQFGSGLSVRVGDGLKVLRPAEADTVIIAGMGGKLIREILSADPIHTKTFRKFIMQPRKGAGPLRKWLLENGFLIVCEDVVREGKFLPEIITAVRPPVAGDPAVTDLAAEDREELCHRSEEDIMLRVPPWTTKARGPLDAYLDLRIGQEKLRLENLRMAKSRDLDEEKKAEENLQYLEALRPQKQKENTANEI